MRNQRAWLMTAAVVSLSLGTIANAVSPDILFQHYGTSDPTTETIGGFNSDGTLGGSAVISGGTPAWKILDTSISAHQDYTAGSSLSPTQKSGIVTRGWEVKWVIEMITAPDPLDDSLNRGIEVNLRLDNDDDGVSNGPNPGTRYNIRLGASGSSATVLLLTGGGYTIPGAGIGTGFHTFELIKRSNSSSNLAKFYVDGVYIADYSGFTDTGGLFAWGSVTNSSLSEVNWNEFTFAIPEPASLSLLGLGAVLAFRRSRPINPQ